MFLHDKNLKGINKGFVTEMILMGHQKSFETTDYGTLLKKVTAIGFSNHSVDLFKSYLSNR